jgi:hypothetical protein
MTTGSTSDEPNSEIIPRTTHVRYLDPVTTWQGSKMAAIYWCTHTYGWSNVHVWRKRDHAAFLDRIDVFSPTGKKTVNLVPARGVLWTWMYP